MEESIACCISLVLGANCFTFIRSMTFLMSTAPIQSRMCHRPSNELSSKTAKSFRSKMSRKCHYNSGWEKEFPFIQKSTKGSSSFYCSWCRKDLSCSNGGRTDVVKHKETNVHKDSDKIVHSSNLNSFASFHVNNTTSDPVVAAELTLCYHNVKHHHSYRSAECLADVIKCALPDSKIAASMTWGKKKVAAIVQNVLAPASVEYLIDKLKTTRAYFSVSSDSTSRKGHRFYPIVLKFFHPDDGIQNFLLDFYEDADETAESIHDCTVSKLSEAGLDINQVSSYSADGAAVNFGRKSGVHKRLADQNPNIKKAHCLAHLLHNASDSAVNSLTADVVTFVSRTYGHFSRSPKRLKELQGFFDFLESEWAPLLSHVSTRFLSLLPAIDRILASWDPLRSYFCSIEERDVPLILRKFFSVGNEDDDSIFKYHVYFLSHSLKVIQDAITKMESNDLTVTTVYNDMLDIVQKFETRRTEAFFGAQMATKLKSLPTAERKKTEEELLEFYDTFIEYVRKRYDFSDNNYHKKVQCLSLNNQFSFNELKDAIAAVKFDVDLDLLFDEYAVLKRFCEENRHDFETKSVVDRYCRFFQSVGSKCTELLKLMFYVLSINCSNAGAERVFSLMGQVWTDDRNRMQVGSVCGELQIIINYQNRRCQDLYREFLKNKRLLSAAKSSLKYKHHNPEGAESKN